MAMKDQSGFTIIELTIVIIVILILASITLVSYSSWRSMAANTEVTNDLQAAAIAMKNYRNFNNGYPSTIPTTFAASPNVSVTVQSASTTSYCLKGKSLANSSVIYYIANTDTTPHTNTC